MVIFSVVPVFVVAVLVVYWLVVCFSGIWGIVLVFWVMPVFVVMELIVMLLCWFCVLVC